MPGTLPPCRLPKRPHHRASGSADIAAVLVEIVADKTGYPADMLELDMRLDTDLGIDSIKRVEIFSALQDRLPESRPAGPERARGPGHAPRDRRLPGHFGRRVDHASRRTVRISCTERTLG